MTPATFRSCWTADKRPRILPDLPGPLPAVQAECIARLLSALDMLPVVRSRVGPGRVESRVLRSIASPDSGWDYPRATTAALFAVIPLTLLGHLTGVAGEGTEKGFLATWCVLIAVFAARKYTQDVKDDIGDKSVFIFNDLTEEEQVALTRRAQQRDPQRFARMMGD